MAFLLSVVCWTILVVIVLPLLFFAPVPVLLIICGVIICGVVRGIMSYRSGNR